MKLRRVLRVLEYSGTEEALRDHLERRGVKGTLRVSGLIIREAVLGDTMEVFNPDLLNNKDRDYQSFCDLLADHELEDVER